MIRLRSQKDCTRKKVTMKEKKEQSKGNTKPKKKIKTSTLIINLIVCNYSIQNTG